MVGIIARQQVDARSWGRYALCILSINGDTGIAKDTQLCNVTDYLIRDQVLSRLHKASKLPHFLFQTRSNRIRQPLYRTFKSILTDSKLLDYILIKVLFLLELTERRFS